MAEHTTSGPAELGAPMDYPAHERTYDQFINLTKLSVIGTINVLVALVLYAYGGDWGFLLGTILLILSLIAGAAGLAGKGSMKPSVLVFVLGVVLVILSVP